LKSPLQVEKEETTSEELICQPQVPQVEVDVMNAACVESVCLDTKVQTKAHSLERKSTDKDTNSPDTAEGTEETVMQGDVEGVHVNSEWKTPLSPEFFYSLEVAIAPSDELLNKSHAPIRDTPSAFAPSYFCNGFESFPDLCTLTPVSGVKAGITSFWQNKV
jgi:hypothetical protein